MTPSGKAVLGVSTLREAACLEQTTVGAWRQASDRSENAGHVMLIGEELIGCLPRALAETPNEMRCA
jgi:hypothetical protein